MTLMADAFPTESQVTLPRAFSIASAGRWMRLFSAWRRFVTVPAAASTDLLKPAATARPLRAPVTDAKPIPVLLIPDTPEPRLGVRARMLAKIGCVMPAYFIAVA